MKLLDSSLVTSCIVLLKYKTHEFNVREQNWEIHEVTEKQSLALFSAFPDRKHSASLLATATPLTPAAFPSSFLWGGQKNYVLLWPAEYELYNPSQGSTPLAVLKHQ